METLVAQFPKQIADALIIASNHPLNFQNEKSFKNVVICGMGGSGIGGEMVQQLFQKDCSTPILIVKDYEIPGFVDQDTLLIVSSYSGNTEETITALQAGRAKKANIIGISSGGELFQICQNHSYPHIKIPGGNPPRSMVAFSLIQIVHILAKAKVIPPHSLQYFENGRDFLINQIISIKENAKLLAQHAFQKNVFLYANTQQQFIALRARQQFNENSKQLCCHHVFPEMNHNELIGWERADEQDIAIFFVSQFTRERTKFRFSLTQKILEEKKLSYFSINGKGTNPVEEALYFIHTIDWASLYLAKLNQVNPKDIRSIDYLKPELKKL